MHLPKTNQTINTLDLNFMGLAGAIAAYLIPHRRGAILVECGPGSTLPTLEASLREQGFSLGDVTDVLLTHIHLDHAGAAGTIARRHPAIRVVVHQRGAPHLVDPTKLLASATRLYGADMDRLWGAVERVPPQRLQVVDGGEELEVAGRSVGVTYTPGHAKHHVSYFDPTSRVAWVGDVAGVCIDGGYVLPPTPPPDIDLPGWRQSIEHLEQMQADTLFLTHCGPITTPRVHLRAFADNLEMVVALARESLTIPGTDDERKAMFDDRLRRELRRHMDEAQAQSYESAAAFGLSWAGLARYLRRIEGLS